MSTCCAVRDVHWIAGHPPAGPIDAFVQIRYNHAASPARIASQARGAAEIRFREPQFGVAPGQIAAFYRDDELLGGGWIADPGGPPNGG
jgi:tRNA-specific 2-thiouridylase